MTKRKILYGYQIRGGALEIVPEEQRVVHMLFTPVSYTHLTLPTNMPV